MLDHALARHAVVLQHVLDEIDAAARPIELVAEHDDKSGRSQCRSRNARKCAGSCSLPACRHRRAARGRNSSASAQSSAIHTAGIEEALRVEALLDAHRQCRDFARLRLEDGHRGAQRVAGADQRRVAAADGAADRSPRRASAPAARASQTRPPPQSRNNRRSSFLRAPQSAPAPAARRDRDAPDRRARSGQQAARRRGSRARASAMHHRRMISRVAEARQLAAQRRGARATEGAGPSTANRGHAPCRHAQRPRPADAPPACARRRDLVWALRAISARAPSRIVEARQQHGARRFGPRQHLELTSVSAASVP